MINFCCICKKRECVHIKKCDFADYQKHFIEKHENNITLKDNNNYETRIILKKEQILEKKFRLNLRDQ